ncbi:MbtH family protein [Streptomyces sp. NPDC001118]
MEKTEDRAGMGDEKILDDSYEVVINHEEQYAVWPAGKTVPPGWRKVGRHGTRADCLEYVREAWKDMRPLSLRRDQA